MNIFYLHDDPVICASYHADQHMHKMILESAQMLCTAVQCTLISQHLPCNAANILYKPAYIKHPCTIWVGQSNNNMLWLCELALALQSERESVANCGIHSSIPIIRLIYDWLQELNPYSRSELHTPHVFCGPATISHRLNMTTIQRYKEFYRRKAQRWPIDTGIQMSYKGRPVPDFLDDLILPSSR